MIMPINRLFIYDKETKTAVCIAKGYTAGWSNMSSDTQHINDFFEHAMEFTGDIKSTRYSLKTEQDMPKNTKISYE